MRRLVPLRWLLFVAVLIGAVPDLLAQEPATRAEELRRAREEKSKELAEPEPSLFERALLDLENGRLFERLLGPPQGLYPRIGNVTAGSGIAFGPGYARIGAFGSHVDYGVSALGSFKKYWVVDGRFALPRLAGERVSINVHARRYDFPEEDFFGIGPDSLRENHVTYRLQGAEGGVTGSVRPLPWLTLGQTVDVLVPDLGVYDRPGAIGSLFTDTEAPGLFEQPTFAHYVTTLDIDYGRPRRNPRTGGRYLFGVHRYEDRDTGRYSFDRVDIDLRQYISLLRERRVLALRAFASLSEAGANVPFYLQRTLGGPDDLRGFRRFRFRDTQMLLLQAEYRWEIFAGVDGVLFYDAGTVAPERRDLTLSGLESDYGFGFRFGTNNGVFLRIEGAFGSSGGKHFILRFGDAF
jgi:hypothetical protein